MKIKNLFLVAISLLFIGFTSCKKDKNDPEPKTQKEYPEGATIWPKDTVVNITDHYIVEKGKSLFIEEGVQIIMNNPDKGPEFVILGNLYCYGTAENPIKFTIPQADRTEANRFSRPWGGIICGYDSEEVLLSNTIIEYACAQTTEESASIKYQLFKTETGEGVPGFHFCNPDGKFVIENCIFRNNAEDHIYITGGKSIIMNTTFYHSGFDGGEAINYKSDCLADISHNLVYDANTNAVKLSNSGLQSLQSHIFVYNNTIINTGWRRPKIKGGSIWLEDNVRAEIYNNIIFDCRFAVKRDVKEPEDNRTIITPNYLFASTTESLAQLVEDAETGQLIGVNDIISATADDKNPMFENFSIQSNIDVMVGITNSGNVPQPFNTNWDFSLKDGSPAKTGGVTNFNPHFSTTGITIDNKEYKSPAPAAYFGAFN